MTSAATDLVIRASIRDELSGPIDGLQKSIDSLTGSVDKLSSSAGAGGKGMDDYGSGIKNAKTNTDGLKDATQSLRNISLLTTASFAGAVTVIARFESSLSELKVASGANVDQMKRLRAAAIEAGKSGIFTETDAVSGMTALAKAGISVEDVLKGGLKGAMSLAAAGGEDLGTAAETMASALSQFNLDGTQASHVADLLAAGAGKAQGSVGDLSESLQYAGLTAHLVGVPIEQTVGTLAMFAQKGLLGSKAGTSFQQMLLRLSPPAGRARDLIHSLGISAFDSGGHFVGLANYADVLRTKLGGMSEEQRQATLSQVFGSHAIQAATILYESGAKGVNDWTKAVNDSGYAADYASGRLDNLSGDTLKLRGSLQALITGSGSATNGMLRSMTQHLTNDVDLFGRLPHGVQSTALAMTGILSVGTLVITTVGLVVTKLKAMELALAEGGAMSRAMGSAVGFARVGMLAAIPVIGIGAAVIDYFGKKAAERKKDVTSLTDAIAQDGNVIGATTRQMIAKSLVDDKAISNGKKLGISASTITTAVVIQGKAYTDLQAKLKGIIEANTHVASSAGSAGRGGALAGAHMNATAIAATRLKDALSDQVGKLKDAQTQAQQEAAALDATSTVNQKVQLATGQSTSAIYAQQLAMQGATDSASALKNILDDLNGTNLSVAQNEVTFRQSLLAIKSAIDSNVKANEAHAHSLDLSSNAGLTNNANVNAAVQNAIQLAQAVTTQTGSIELGALKFAQYRGELEKSATDAGISKREIDKLLDSIMQLPNLKPQVPVHADTKPAKHEVAAWRASLAATSAIVPIGANPGPANAAVNRFLKHVGELRPTLSVDGVVSLITPSAPLGSTANPKQNAGVPFKSLGNGRAFGGPVVGGGSARSDSVLTPLSSREWIMPWDAREYYGDGFMAAVQNRALPRMAGADAAPPARGGYAGGITFEAGAVHVDVHGDATPREIAAADIPGQVAEGLRRWQQDRDER